MSDANADLISEISGFIEQYIVFPDAHTSRVLACYVIHTWSMDYCQVTPYLYVHSPEKGSGKTTLLEVLGKLVRNSLRTSNMTPSTMFAKIELDSPTIMLDEVDTIFASSTVANKELRGLINDGYKRGGVAIRRQGAGTQEYNVFGPKVLAGIHNGFLPDTIADRSIPITLRKKKAGAQVKPFYSSLIGNATEPILVKIEEWVEANGEDLRNTLPEPIDGLSDRESEISWPLLAIAEKFGIREEIKNSIRSMILVYKAHVAAQDKSVEFLRSMAELFYLEGRKVHTNQVLEWLGFTGTKAAVKLAELCAIYRIEPKNVRLGNHVAKGYTFEQFEREFEINGINID